MKKAVKILGAILLLLIVAVIAVLTYVSNFLPDVKPAGDLQITVTDSLLTRGEYLANHVTVCIDCHSERDWTKYSGPIVPRTNGGGGDIFDHNMGFPGTFYARNITPSGIGDWTNGELARLITTGVTKDGEPIFPVMPYQSYASLDPFDLQAIITYIRTLKPINNNIPESSADFPMNFIMRTIPKDSESGHAPERSDSIAYGRYLVKIAGCADCHTEQVNGQPKEGMYLAGGFQFNLPGHAVVSANITPDEETGIGYWDKETFIDKFKFYSQPDAAQDVAEDGYNTVMPWTMYGGMTEEDLGAIFDYLMAIKPVSHKFERYIISEAR